MVVPSGVDPFLGMSLPTYDPTPTAPIEASAELWASTEMVRSLNSDLSEAQIMFGLRMASRILWAATARQYGLRRRTARPEFGGCCGQCSRYQTRPFIGADLSAPDLPAQASCRTTERCGCRELDELRLPGPIAAVEGVWIDGEWFEGKHFQIGVGRSSVVWRDRSKWPCSQDTFRDADQQWPPVIVENCDPGYDIAEALAGAPITERPVDRETRIPLWIAAYADATGIDVVGSGGITHVEDGRVLDPAASEWAVEALSRPDLAYAAAAGTRPDWYESLLAAAGVDVVWGTSDCSVCTDERNRRTDDLGRYFVCPHPVTGVPAATQRCVSVRPLGCASCAGGPRPTRVCGCGPIVVPANSCPTGSDVEFRVEIPEGASWSFEYLLEHGDLGGHTYVGVAPATTGPFSTTVEEPDCGTSSWGTAQPPSELIGLPDLMLPDDDPARAALEAAEGAALASGSTMTVKYDPGSGSAWEVVYWIGRRIPEEARWVAAQLASYLGSTMEPNGACNLSPFLAEEQRQGVKLKFHTPAELFALNGAQLTGLQEIDYWILAVNPGGLQSRPRVIRADNPRRKHAWRYLDGGS